MSSSLSIIIKKSIAASLFITVGVAVLLTIGEPIGAFLFSFGLLSVCCLGGNLFTGQCGYVIERKNYWQTLIVLIINLVAGWCLGAALGLANPSLIAPAAAKIISWTTPIQHFIQAFFCGSIMFLAVEMHNHGSSLGILYGIPLFIFCKFQHCIANIILLGITMQFSLLIIVAILGNWLGSMFVWFLIRKGCVK